MVQLKQALTPLTQTPLNKREMTAKEKAKELHDKFMNHAYGDTKVIRELNAKKCALIAVDEIILSIWQIDDLRTEGRFWGEVKSELESL